MSRGTIWISLRRLKAQEFRNTLRHLKKSGAGWPDIYLRLGELYFESQKKFAKQNLAIFAIYLAVSSLSDGRNVAISLGKVTASVATEYVAFIASLSIFYSVSQLQTAATLLQLKIIEGKLFRLRGFSPDHFALYHGQDQSSLNVPIVLSSFHTDKFGFSWALLLISIVMIVLSTVPIFLVLFFFIKLQMDILTASSSFGLLELVASAGLLTLVFSLIYLVLFNVPIPFSRNKYSIRWGFLFPLSLTEIHPRAETWIDTVEKQ